MQNVIIQVNFTNLNPEIAAKIQEAMIAGQNFALYNNKPVGQRTGVIFSPKYLKSYWIDRTGFVQAGYKYNNIQAFIDAVSIQLLSHKVFISEPILVEMTDKKLLKY